MYGQSDFSVCNKDTCLLDLMKTSFFVSEVESIFDFLSNVENAQNDFIPEVVGGWDTVFWISGKNVLIYHLSRRLTDADVFAF